MGRSIFQFKQFAIEQDRCAMKVTTDSCLFGAWTTHQLKRPKKILDIGAGTGLLSLMIAQETDASLDAVEIESSCYHQLKENIGRSPFSERINTFHQDINHHNQHGYDAIISNPPFHQDQLTSDDKRINYARHEEGLSLEQLFQIASNLINGSGPLFILLPFYRKKNCLELALSMGWFPLKTANVSHSRKHTPFRAMFMFSKEEKQCCEEEIFIHDEGEQYTETFSQLLQPYYLYL
jgi:tRNA1Val (adenine37-N6)-methyltransferase